MTRSIRLTQSQTEAALTLMNGALEAATDVGKLGNGQSKEEYFRIAYSWLEYLAVQAEALEWQFKLAGELV